MNYNKLTKPKVITLASIMLLSYLYFSGEKEATVFKKSSVETSYEENQPPQASKKSIKLSREKSPVKAKRQLSSIDNSMSEKQNETDIDKIYKDKFLKGSEAKKLKEEVNQIFKNAKNKENIEKWIVMSLYFSGEEGFESVMLEARENLIANSKEVFLDIMDAQYEIAKDPFVEQASLSVISILDLPGSKKAEYYETVIQRKLWVESGKLDDASLNISTAMAFMKQENLEPERIGEILSIAISENEHDPAALERIFERIAAYYPEFL